MSSLDNDESLPPINVSVAKRRRNLPGRPDPDAEVIALSPRSLLTTNRFVCEICGKGFQRDQNLQLHRRGHNLPWRLKQKESHEYRKKVYICPELNCVHHNPARALGDLTGIKKHFSRKHGEKKWKCDKCSKKYAVQSDWKAHQKTCGTKEYRCDCGYLFSRKDSFITHRAFCDVLENKKDSPCNDDQGKKLVASLDKVADENTVESDMPAPMDLAASPASPGSGGEGPTCSEFLKSSPNERGSDHAIPESGVAVLSPKWLEGAVRADNCGSKQKAELSLRLGTDFEPGPPNEPHVLCTQNAPGPILGFPSPRCPSKLEFSPLASSGTQMTSKHAPSVGAMGMLASLFTSSAHRQSGVDSIDSVSHAFSNSDNDHLSLSAGLSSSAHGLRTACGPSKAYLHTSSAATSATALLQKAAELGSKASNPSMFQWCGVGGMDSKWSTKSQGLPRESPWPGFNESHLTSMESKARRPEEYTIGTEFLGSQSLSRKGDGVHAIGPSDGACLPGGTLLNARFQGKVGDGQAVLKRRYGNEEGNSSAMLSDSGCAFQMGCAQQHKGGGSQTGGGEKRMVDFLGVNSIGTTVSRSRGSAGMGQILPHRDLARGTSLTSETMVPKRFHYPNSSAG